MDEEINKFRHDWQIEKGKNEFEQEKQRQKAKWEKIGYVLTIILSAVCSIIVNVLVLSHGR